MKDTREVRLNESDANEAKNQLIELLRAEGKLKLEKITHQDSSIIYHFCANTDEYKDVVIDIQVNDTTNCGELETFAV